VKILFKILLILFFTVKTVAAGEKDKYNYLWLDPDKSVYVLQNKEFETKNTFYTDIGFIRGISAKFQDVTGFKAELGYFINEEWAFEVFYNKYKNSNNEAFKSVQANNTIEPAVRRLTSTYGAMVIWSPFYGKINTFNKIYYFDWSFGVGIAKINTETNNKSVTQGDKVSTFDPESFTGPAFKSKLKFHINKNWNIGIEFQMHYYKAQGPIAAIPANWRANTDGILSIGFSF